MPLGASVVRSPASVATGVASSTSGAPASKYSANVNEPTSRGTWSMIPLHRARINHQIASLCMAAGARKTAAHAFLGQTATMPAARGRVIAIASHNSDGGHFAGRQKLPIAAEVR